ncbi:hypothetical protein BDQ12DRAFT_729286 [Crucibulum laeve]|uniref:Uncharacterized protein n=1 Tax=Crucibulum laeve TaxID=68775 RepID=A0A5C3LGA8_9AGAR|nr:hypothetical protein BDQ12DRAFT_729286 [Crucibulum laeve]
MAALLAHYVHLSSSPPQQVIFKGSTVRVIPPQSSLLDLRPLAPSLLHHHLSPDSPAISGVELQVVLSETVERWSQRNMQIGWAPIAQQKPCAAEPPFIPPNFPPTAPLLPALPIIDNQAPASMIPPIPAPQYNNLPPDIAAQYAALPPLAPPKGKPRGRAQNNPPALTPASDLSAHQAAFPPRSPPRGRPRGRVQNNAIPPAFPPPLPNLQWKPPRIPSSETTSCS